MSGHHHFYRSILNFQRFSMIEEVARGSSSLSRMRHRATEGNYYESPNYLCFLISKSHIFMETVKAKNKLFLVIITIFNFSKSWSEAKIGQLEWIRDNRLGDISVTAIAVNKACSRSDYFQEDCSYVNALQTIDSNYRGFFNL